jgi:YggT family protein
MRLLKGRRKYQMNSNIEIVGLILSLLNYCFVFLMIFNLLKVNYFNPIVSTFVKIYKPISKILPTLINPVINIFVIAVGLKLLSLIVYFGSQYETITLLGVAIIQTLMVTVRIIFFAVIGGVILSWVSPEKSNAFLELVVEISYKSLEPIRKYIPSAGGLDFSPLFVLILINLIESFLSDILRSIV